MPGCGRCCICAIARLVRVTSLDSSIGLHSCIFHVKVKSVPDPYYMCTCCDSLDCDFIWAKCHSCGPINSLHAVKGYCIFTVFVFSSDSLRCTPVNIIVDKKRDIEAELSSKGFKPPVIRIDEGTAIQWKWSACEVPIVISEATYSHSTGKLCPVESEERYHHLLLNALYIRLVLLQRNHSI